MDPRRGIPVTLVTLGLVLGFSCMTLSCKTTDLGGEQSPYGVLVPDENELPTDPRDPENLPVTPPVVGPVTPPPGSSVTPDPGVPTGTERCAPLPVPTGAVIRVQPSQASQLVSIVQGAAAGTTILLEDGYYSVPGIMLIAKDHITLRSASGNPASVQLDNGYTNDFIQIRGSDVTVAELTILKSGFHLIHVSGGAERALLYRLRLIDAAEQFIKINPLTLSGPFPDYGTVACSDFTLTADGRPRVHTYGTGCYTGGIDAHASRGWVIRDNVIKDIYCTNGGLAEHAVHFWQGGRDTLVERNKIINCARGVGFGLTETPVPRIYSDHPESAAPVPSKVGHVGGIIRNNFIYGNIGSRFDTGIELDQAWGVVVYHNTVYSTGSTFSSIDARFVNTNAVIRNNLISPASTVRNSATPVRENNIAATAAMFVNASTGDLHLKAGASPIGRGLSVGIADDIDGEARPAAAPDVGADQFLEP